MLGITRSMTFLRLKHVIRDTGLSKTEIYRRIREGRFPQPRKYADAPNKSFWLDAEVKSWQTEQLFKDLFG